MSRLISETYQTNSKYLKADKLPKDKDVPLTIAGSEPVELNGETKEELTFDETEKILRLNQTNAFTVAALHGDDPADWAGKRIALYRTVVPFQNKPTDAIRVRDRAPAVKAASKPEITDDDIPF